MASLSYPKSVRLHYRKDFQALLDSASTHYNAVFKVFWLVRECPEGVKDGSAGDVACVAGSLAPETGVCGDVSRVSGGVAPETGVNPAGCRFAVSVPKKSFKRAVKRNLLKRRTREAIRLNRHILPEGFCADFLFFYRVGELLDYADIEKAVVEAFTAVPAKAAAKAASAAGTAEANTPDTSAEANLVDANAVESSSKNAENAQLDNSDNTSGNE